MPEREKGTAPEDLDRGRRLCRRRWARLSFAFMLVAATLIVLSVTVLPHPKEAAEAVSAASPVLISIFGFFTSLVLGYQGMSVAETIMKKEG